MENKEIWIRFEENKPILIETHWIGEKPRSYPVVDVDDLKRAFRNSVAPLLDPVSVSLMDVHSMVKGIETTLDPGQELALLGDEQGLEKNPLIIHRIHIFYDQPSYYIPFWNQNQVLMTPEGLLDWLSVATTDPFDYHEARVVSQMDIDKESSPQSLLPLSGREESIEFIHHCFSVSYQNRHMGDPNHLRIPVCTSPPGMGKTRLLNESFTKLEMKGKKLSATVSLERGPYPSLARQIDINLGIECSFAWRILHSFFKCHYRFEDWIREKSPRNRVELDLPLALSVLERFWRSTTNDDIFVFVGIDECQNLSQYELYALFRTICKSTMRPQQSKLSLFCMLAGNDLILNRMVRPSHDYMSQIPIRLLTHLESMNSIVSWISDKYPDFVITEEFSRTVFYLSGIPRLLTMFTDALSQSEPHQTIGYFDAIRREVLSYDELSLPILLKLLAISFTNTPVTNLDDRPFRSSVGDPARFLTWDDMIKKGLCLVQGDQVIVPFHLVLQVLERNANERYQLNDHEIALLTSLCALSFGAGSPAWLSWEAFGASFYRIRINSFLVLGKSTISLSQLFHGSLHHPDFVQTWVEIRDAETFPCNEHYGPDMPQIITRKGQNHLSVDWFQGGRLPIVLNNHEGAGVTIFFILKRADEDGYILVLDQRKGIAAEMTNSSISASIANIPELPLFLKKFDVEPVFGFMTMFSKPLLKRIPESVFLVSANESEVFHGTLLDYPGCSIAINPNFGMRASLCQLFQGSMYEKMRLANLLLSQRNKKKIESMTELSSMVSEWNGEFDESAKARVKF